MRRPRVIELGPLAIPRLLRIYLVACLAIACAFLLVHAREPLRLDVGDPWSDAGTLSSVAYVQHHGFTSDVVDVDPRISDSYHPLHDPPLTEILYGVLGALGAGDIGTFRLVALGFSMLGVWLLFQYARRIWGDPVALLAAALFATSFLWLTSADSLHRPPLMHASCFLALWGLVRAIETRLWRHHAAAFAGSFACLFAAHEDWLFLAAGVLFTIAIKLGHPFARGRRRFVLICAAGGLAAIFARSLFVTHPPGWQGVIDRNLGATLPALLHHATLVFTPMVWITLGCTTWRALRARSVTAALEDGTTWMLVATVVYLYAASPHAASPALRAQPVLPFYALGSAISIARLLEGGRLHRSLAVAWSVAAPAWAFYVVLSHPRSVLDRDEVARVRAYLAASDRNDFVMSNLLSDGPIQAAFDRHSWLAPEADDEIDARLELLDVFETAGTDYVHAVIFTTPESRFTDRALGQLAMRRPPPAMPGWPELDWSGAAAVIRGYDHKVQQNLAAVGAAQVLHLRNFDVYRIDRPTVLALIARSIPVVRDLDFSSLGSNKHKLLGWGKPWLTTRDQLGVTSIEGHAVCSNPVVEDHAGAPATNACETLLTRTGLKVLDQRATARAQLMIRVERACDLRLTLELASPALVGVSINEFTTSACAPADRVSFVIPARSIRAGTNVLTFDNQRFEAKPPKADVRSLAIEPVCEPAR